MFYDILRVECWAIDTQQDTNLLMQYKDHFMNTARNFRIILVHIFFWSLLLTLDLVAMISCGKAIQKLVNHLQGIRYQVDSPGGGPGWNVSSLPRNLQKTKQWRLSFKHPWGRPPSTSRAHDHIPITPSNIILGTTILIHPHLNHQDRLHLWELDKCLPPLEPHHQRAQIWWNIQDREIMVLIHRTMCH